MKLVLRGFSQEIDVTDLTEATSYLVFEDESTGQLVRLPVPQETITALSGIIVSGSEAQTEESESEEDVFVLPKYTTPKPPEPQPVPTPKKTLRAPLSENEVPDL